MKIEAAQRLMAAKEKVPTKVSVRNWLIKHYGFQPGYSGDSNPYSSYAEDYGIVKDPAKLRALGKALEDAGFKKEIVEGHTSNSVRYSQGGVSFTLKNAGGNVWVSIPKKAKQSMRFSPYD